MHIRIITLTLHNFKGVLGERTYTFDGKNARVEGDNATGKSTIFDAFTWLLFGKDHLGHDWTNFDLKPIDAQTHETIHNAPGGHWVEAVLSIDGRTRTLRRYVEENWVKPRGEVEAVFKGHSQSFFIDGVDCATKKAYDEAIHEWIDEEVFKIITNPLYFIDNNFTKWEVRRKVLLGCVGYDPTVADANFPDVVAELKGEPVEQIRKRLAAEKKAQREQLEKSVAAINAWNAALPEPIDADATGAQLKVLKAEGEKEKAPIRARIAEIDKGIADAGAAAEGINAQIAAKKAEMRGIKEKMEDYLAEGLKAEKTKESARLRAISDAEQSLTTANSELDALEARERATQQKCEEYQEARNDEAARLKALGEAYHEETAKAFTPDVDTVCPTCGRPYPEDAVAAETEKRLATWEEERRAAVARIKERAEVLRAELSKWDESLASARARHEDIRMEMINKRTQIQQLKQAVVAARAVPPVDLSAAELALRKSAQFKEYDEQLAALLDDVRDLGQKTGSPTELLAERRALEAQLAVIDEEKAAQARELTDALAVSKERSRIEGLIAAEDERRAGYAEELARLERLEVRTLQYIKESIDACEDAINLRFKAARWRLFDRTIDGGLIPMCEVTTLDGVPYASMNSAARIVCGLDVIRVLSESREVVAPIFIDNAEGITRTDFGTAAQVIRLVVTPGIDAATVTEE